MTSPASPAPFLDTPLFKEAAFIDGTMARARASPRSSTPRDARTCCPASNGCATTVRFRWCSSVTSSMKSCAWPGIAVCASIWFAYGLAGLRIGYAVADPDIITALSKVYVPFTATSVSQAAAIASLDAADELLARTDAVVAERARSAIRSDDLAGRIGGDEFVVLLRGIELEFGGTAPGLVLRDASGLLDRGGGRHIWRPAR